MFDEMRDNVINKFGFEADETIIFCSLCGFCEFCKSCKSFNDFVEIIKLFYSYLMNK